MVRFCYLLGCSASKCPIPAAFGVPFRLLSQNKIWQELRCNVFFLQIGTSWGFFSKFPTSTLVHFMWEFPSGVLHQDRAYQSASYHCLNSLLHYVRIPRLITTACLKGGKRYNTRKKYSVNHKKVMSICFFYHNKTPKYCSHILGKHGGKDAVNLPKTKLK